MKEAYAELNVIDLKYLNGVSIILEDLYRQYSKQNECKPTSNEYKVTSNECMQRMLE